MKLLPEILTHPHIPKPLHSVNPRTIKGKEWWDNTRQQVYASTNYHCIACGVHKSKAKGNRWLEAHEFWIIDYATGICEIKGIYPLCPYCHKFIHSGFLALQTNRSYSIETTVLILEHGFKILSLNKLRCFPFTYELAKVLHAKTFNVKPYDLPNNVIFWNDWKLIWKGKEYYSLDNNQEEWKERYSR